MTAIIVGVSITTRCIIPIRPHGASIGNNPTNIATVSIIFAERFIAGAIHAIIHIIRPTTFFRVWTAFVAKAFGILLRKFVFFTGDFTQRKDLNSAVWIISKMGVQHVVTWFSAGCVSWETYARHIRLDILQGIDLFSSMAPAWKISTETVLHFNTPRSQSTIGNAITWVHVIVWCQPVDRLCSKLMVSQLVDASIANASLNLDGLNRCVKSTSFRYLVYNILLIPNTFDVNNDINL